MQSVKVYTHLSTEVTGEARAEGLPPPVRPWWLLLALPLPRLLLVPVHLDQLLLKLILQH